MGGGHSAANQEAFNGVMAAVATFAKVDVEIVPYIGGCDAPRELKIDHKKVDVAFEFNFHEDKKAQYQPRYMAGAYSGGQAPSKGEVKKKSRGAQWH
jgi:hypothetical protein